MDRISRLNKHAQRRLGQKNQTRHIRTICRYCGMSFYRIQNNQSNKCQLCKNHEGPKKRFWTNLLKYGDRK